MSIDKKIIESSPSLSNRKWKLKKFDERNVIYLAQKYDLKYIVSKLINIRGIDDDSILPFLNPDINKDLPNPDDLKDINKATTRVIDAIKKNQKIGIIADYDVDGSTSASILFKFLRNFITKNFCVLIVFFCLSLNF